MSLSADTFRFVADLVRRRSAIELMVGKESLVESRLMPLVRQAGRAGVDEYVSWVRDTANGVFFIDPSVIGADGRAVAPDGQSPFAGQVFFNAPSGDPGSLQPLQFNGPTNINWDASLIKNIPITERVGVQLRGEFFNVLNHPIFFISSQDINSPNFGQITQTLNLPRVVQLAAKFTF